MILTGANRTLRAKIVPQTLSKHNYYFIFWKNKVEKNHVYK